MPVAAPPQIYQPPTAGSDILNGIIPNFSGLSTKSSSVINNLLNGTPSTGTAQNAAATFGATNGLGTGSGIANRFGYDLYGQQGAQRQQQGLQDLSQLIPSLANPTLENQGQNQQNQQFYSNLGQQGQQFQQSNQTQQNQQLSALIAQLSGGGGGESVGPGQFAHP